MSSYIQSMEAAQLRSRLLYGFELAPPLSIDNSRVYAAEVLGEVVADLADVVPNARALPGNCFAVVRECSYVLFELGIDNVVTIGNVTLNGEPHFTTSAESIDAEMREGFEPTKPANAHAWLTLDSGQVLDPTILPSWAYHGEQRDIQLEEAVFLSGVTEPPVSIRFDPMMTGYAYHLRVVSHPLAAESFQRYSQWLQDASVFKRRIERSSTRTVAPQ